MQLLRVTELEKHCKTMNDRFQGQYSLLLRLMTGKCLQNADLPLWGEHHLGHSSCVCTRCRLKNGWRWLELQTCPAPASSLGRGRGPGRSASPNGSFPERVAGKQTKITQKQCFYVKFIQEILVFLASDLISSSFLLRCPLFLQYFLIARKQLSGWSFN